MLRASLPNPCAEARGEPRQRRRQDRRTPRLEESRSQKRQKNTIFRHSLIGRNILTTKSRFTISEQCSQSVRSNSVPMQYVVLIISSRRSRSVNDSGFWIPMPYTYHASCPCGPQVFCPLWCVSRISQQLQWRRKRGRCVLEVPVSRVSATSKTKASHRDGSLSEMFTRYTAGIYR